MTGNGEVKVRNSITVNTLSISEWFYNERREVWGKSAICQMLQKVDNYQTNSSSRSIQMHYREKERNTRKQSIGTTGRTWSARAGASFLWYDIGRRRIECTSGEAETKSISDVQLKFIYLFIAFQAKFIAFAFWWVWTNWWVAGWLNDRIKSGIWRTCPVGQSGKECVLLIYIVDVFRGIFIFLHRRILSANLMPMCLLRFPPVLVQRNS